MKNRLISIFGCALLLISGRCYSQHAGDDPEFRKEFIMHARLHSGLVTDFHAATDPFIGGAQLIPQYTIIESRLRLGIITGLLYSEKKVQGLFGPAAHWKIKTISDPIFGSLGNINLGFEHLWGTQKQRLAGLSVNLDFINRVIIGISAHRDYRLNTWWFQSTAAYRMSKVPKTKPPI